METFFLNFSLEFLSKIFCLHFVFRIDETTEGIFLVNFFSHFFHYFAIDQILFFLIKKRNFSIFFSSHDTKLLLCFNEFFFETPKKQKKVCKEMS